jgi:hypothetical protein
MRHETGGRNALSGSIKNNEFFYFIGDKKYDYS